MHLRITHRRGEAETEKARKEESTRNETAKRRRESRTLTLLVAEFPRFPSFRYHTNEAQREKRKAEQTLVRVAREHFCVARCAILEREIWRRLGNAKCREGRSRWHRLIDNSVIELIRRLALNFRETLGMSFNA